MGKKIKIGGLQRTTLIDYPGHLSCIIFLSGCNFKCPYCYNPNLAKGYADGNLSQEIIFHFLESRRGFLDGVTISGGEPTIHEGLVPFCEKIKTMEYAIKLDTNGSKPKVINELINNSLVDYIAMDIKTDPMNYHTMAQDDTDVLDIIESVHAVMDSDIDYEFRTTCVKPFISAQNVTFIGLWIEGAKFYALQKFVDTKVLYPDFFCNNRIACGDAELSEFKKVMLQYVDKCIIR